MIKNPTTRPEYSTFERISKFIEDTINEEVHKKYLLGLLEVVAYSANIPFHVMKDHPKAIERALIQNIVQKLSVLKNSEHWDRDTPSLVELSTFFGIPRHTFDSVTFTKDNMLYRVFNSQELLTIATILKSKLGPVDSKACTELLLELGNYDPIQRVADIRQQFPTWTSWINYEHSAIHGDSDSIYPLKWNRPSWKGTMKEKLAWSQGGFYKGGVLQFFDGISGKIYRIDDPNLEIHHINFDKADSSFNNLLLIHKDSHITRFAETPQGDFQKRKYISIGKMLKLAFIYGFPPRSWNSQIRAEFVTSLNSQARRFI